ncbi:MAG: helix-turn-helix transcriptional regulator, partial [Rubrivivax sp.]|nr:helix-turn-helix transcriptional regulator [Rubrivivax sp.]
LKLLADGLTPLEAAEKLGVERTTVRTHMRSLRGKTGRRSQSALVRLLAGT